MIVFIIWRIHTRSCLIGNTPLLITISPNLLNISCNGNRECDLCNAIMQEKGDNCYCVSLGVFQIAPWNV